MNQRQSRTTPPSRVLVFGAAGHIGRPVADHLRSSAPTTRLRLVSRSEQSQRVLGTRYPGAEVVSADYSDLASLVEACRDIDGMFVITPPGTDESMAMTNLVEACRRAGSSPHIVRQTAFQPELSPRLIPEWMKRDGTGIPMQHPIAKSILEDSGHPLTFVNTLATFIDNFAVHFGAPIREKDMLVCPPRTITYLAPTDIGEFAARMFLTLDSGQDGQFHSINNGIDLLSYEEVAGIMSEVFGRAVGYDGSRESYFREYAFLGDDTLNYLWHLFEWDRAYEVSWSRNDLLERYLGRRPISVRAYLVENSQLFQPVSQPV